VIRIVAGASALALAPSAAFAAASAPRGLLSQQTCSVDIRPIVLGGLDRPVHLPLRVEVRCPAGTAYQISLFADDACGRMRTLDAKGTPIAFDVRLPDGSSWCDGTGGTSRLSSVGTGNVQEFTATVDLVPARGILPAGHHETVLRYQLETQ